MSTESALLATVCAAPEDDGPRLVYADWLEETGEPANVARAEFIRAQCELARPAAKGASARRAGLRKRVKALYSAHSTTWESILPAALTERRYGDYLYRWARGFFSWADYPDLDTFFATADAVFTSQPIDGLSVSRLRKEQFAAFANSPHLAGLRTLNLYHSSSRGEQMGDEEAALLAASPYLGNLRSLNVIQQAIHTEGFRAIAHSPHLKSLQQLHLYGNEHDDETARMLVNSPLAARLREWDLAGSHRGVTDETGRILAQAPSLAHITSLDLNNTTIGDEGIRQIAGAAHFKKLRKLILHASSVGNAGVRAIAQSPHLADLRELILSRTNCGQAGLKALIESPYLQKVKLINLYDVSLSPATEKALVNRFGKHVDFGRWC